MGYELRTKCRQDISQQSVPGAAKRDVMGEDDAHAAEETNPKYSVKLRPERGICGESRRISTEGSVSCHINISIGWGGSVFDRAGINWRRGRGRETRDAMVLACGGAHGAAHPGAGTFPSD